VATIGAADSDGPEQWDGDLTHDPVVLPAPRHALDDLFDAAEALRQLEQQRAELAAREAGKSGWLCLASRILEAWGSTLRAVTLLCVLLGGAVATVALGSEATTPLMGLPVGLSLIIGVTWSLLPRFRRGKPAVP
jgi:hypothetical protein